MTRLYRATEDELRMVLSVPYAELLVLAYSKARTESVRGVASLPCFDTPCSIEDLSHLASIVLASPFDEAVLFGGSVDESDDSLEELQVVPAPVLSGLAAIPDDEFPGLVDRWMGVCIPDLPAYRMTWEGTSVWEAAFEQFRGTLRGLTTFARSAVSAGQRLYVDVSSDEFR